MEREFSKRRAHFLSILENAWGIILAIFIAIFNQTNELIEFIQDVRRNGLSELTSEDSMIGFLILLVIILICAFIVFFRWLRTTISFKDGILVYEKNTLFSQRNELSSSSISNVNLEQNVFERIVGIYKVKFDTSTLSTANRTDVCFVLGKKDAFALKSIVMECITSEKVKPEHAATVEKPIDQINSSEEVIINPEAADNGVDVDLDRDYDFKVSEGESFMCALGGMKFMSVVSLVIAIIGTVVIFVELIKTGANQEAFVTVGIFALGIIYAMVKSLLKNWFKNYDFRVKRKGDIIYLRSGALKVRSYSVPLKHTQAVRLNCTFFGKLMNRVSVNVINVGGEDDDVDGQWLLPALRFDELKEVLERILPEYEIKDDKEMHSRASRMVKFDFVDGLLSDLIMNIFYLGVMVFIFKTFTNVKDEFLGMPLWLAVLYFIFYVGNILWDLFAMYWRNRTCKIYMNDKRMWIKDGVFSYKYYICDFDKVQFIEAKSSPIKRIFKVKDAIIHILGSSIASDIDINPYEAETVDTMIESFSRSFK